MLARRNLRLDNNGPVFCRAVWLADTGALKLARSRNHIGLDDTSGVRRLIKPGDPVCDHRLAGGNRLRAPPPIVPLHNIDGHALLFEALRAFLDPFADARIEAHLGMELQSEQMGSTPKRLMAIDVSRSEQFGIARQVKCIAVPMKYWHVGEVRNR